MSPVDVAIDLLAFGAQLRSLRRTVQWSQQDLITELDLVARSGPTTEYRVVDATLLSRWERAHTQNGRTWKPTRTYVLYLIRLFAAYLDVERAQHWAGQAGYALTEAELQPFLSPLPPSPSAPRLETDKITPLPTPDSLWEPSLSHNLPASLTSFLGREEEIEQLLAYLADPTIRLITLVGEGGIGKTRLVLTAAEQVVQSCALREPAVASSEKQVARFAHGIWFVPLAGMEIDLNDRVADLLATAIAKAISFSPGEFQGNPAEQLIHYLRKKSMLIILDNFEHLLAGVPFVLDVLAQAPKVRFLVTSRLPLNCRAEHVMRLRGLQVYPPGNVHASESPCIQLFEQRVRQQQPEFTLKAVDLQSMVDLCHWVNGNPLALELASYWVQHLSVNEIVAALKRHDFTALASTKQDIPKRQRSMEAIFETSLGLLSPEQQRVLVQLSVFRGQFTRQAALTVTGTSLDVLAALVDRSLLHMVRDVSGQNFYLMHDLLRQFAGVRLAAFDDGHPGLAEQTYHLHSDIYLHLIGEQGAMLYGIESASAAAKCQANIDNVHAAWRWAVLNGNLSALSNAWYGLRTFYHMFSLFQEGEEIFRWSAAHLNAPETPAAQELQAEFEVAHAFFLNLLHRYDEVVAIAQRVLSMLAGKPESPLMARALLEWGRALSLQSLPGEALDRLNQTVAMAHRLRLPIIEARALQGVSRVWLAKGEYAQSCASLERALLLYREVGHRLQEASVHYMLGDSAQSYGKPREALAHLEVAHVIYHEAGDQSRLLTLCKPMGDAYFALGDLGKAYSYYLTAYTQREKIRDLRHTANLLKGFGRLLGELGVYDLARTYSQQSVNLQHQIGCANMIICALTNLGWISVQTGSADLALTTYEEVIAISQTVPLRLNLGRAYLGKGNALMLLGQYDSATEAYEEALTVQQTLGQLHLLPECWAGLAQLAAAQCRNEEALGLVEQIADFLNPKRQPRADVPFSVYLTCIQIWQTVADPRAKLWLTAIHQRLMQRAATLNDEMLRRSYLEEVSANRNIIELYRRMLAL